MSVACEILPLVHHAAPHGDLLQNIQSDILEIHNFMESSYQYDTMKLLEKQKALTQLLKINVYKHILSHIQALCHNSVTSMFFNLDKYHHFQY